MKKNVIAVVLLLILGAVAVWLIKTRSSGSMDSKLQDFAVADTASITKIFLADKANNTVTLTRETPAAWKVNGKFYARDESIRTLLTTIRTLEVKAPVGKKAQDNIIKNLASGGIKVEIYKGDKLIKLYYVGGETPDALGTYMLMADEKTGKNSSVPFIMYIPGFEGYLTTRYFTNEADWRDRTVFRYVPTGIKSVKVEYPDKPEEGFEVITKGDNLYEVKALATNAPVTPMDTMAVKQYLSYFQNIQFEAIEKDKAKINHDSIVASVPLAIITLTDQKGTINQAKCFRKRATEGKLDIQGNPMQYDIDRFYAVINEGQDFVLCQYYVFGKLFMSPDYFNSKRELVKK